MVRCLVLDSSTGCVFYSAGHSVFCPGSGQRPNGRSGGVLRSLKSELVTLLRSERNGLILALVAANRAKICRSLTQYAVRKVCKHVDICGLRYHKWSLQWYHHDTTTGTISGTSSGTISGTSRGSSSGTIGGITSGPFSGINSGTASSASGGSASGTTGATSGGTTDTYNKYLQ